MSLEMSACWLAILNLTGDTSTFSVADGFSPSFIGVDVVGKRPGCSSSAVLGWAISSSLL